MASGSRIIGRDLGLPQDHGNLQLSQAIGLDSLEHVHPPPGQPEFETLRFPDLSGISGLRGSRPTLTILPGACRATPHCSVKSSHRNLPLIFPGLVSKQAQKLPFLRLCRSLRTNIIRHELTHIATTIIVIMPRVSYSSSLAGWPDWHDPDSPMMGKVSNGIGLAPSPLSKKAKR